MEHNKKSPTPCGAWSDKSGYSLVVERDLAMVETGVRFSLPAHTHKVATLKGRDFVCTISRGEEANCFASVENRSAGIYPAQAQDLRRRPRVLSGLRALAKQYA